MRLVKGFRRRVWPTRKAAQPGEARKLRQQDDALRSEIPGRETPPGTKMAGGGLAFYQDAQRFFNKFSFLRGRVQRWKTLAYCVEFETLWWNFRNAG